MARSSRKKRSRPRGAVSEDRKRELESLALPESELKFALKSPLEYELWLDIKDEKLPLPQRQFMFAKKELGRLWRSDFCWPDFMVIVEVEGGTNSRGRHVRPVGFENDCYKYNAATEMGYELYRYTAKMIRNKDAIAQIRRVIKKKEEENEIRGKTESKG